MLGYPTGGDTISVTRGVVSRIEPQRYAHGIILVLRPKMSEFLMRDFFAASGHLLAVQIDAAINPGNSGGPVLKGDKVTIEFFLVLSGHFFKHSLQVVGVAFQSLVNAENMGFIIPVPIINHFINDLELHGKYTVCRAQIL